MITNKLITKSIVTLTHNSLGTRQSMLCSARYLCVTLVMLFAFGIGNAWGSRYGRGNAYLKEGGPTGAGQVYVSVASSSTSANSGWKDCTTAGTSAEVEGAKTAMTFTFKSKVNNGYKFTGWYSKNADGTYKLLTKETTYSTSTTTGAEPTGYSDLYTDVNCYAEFIKIVHYSFIVPEHGTYTITNNGVAVANYATTEAQGVVHLSSTPDEGYRFAGWYTSTDGGTTKNYFSFDSGIDLNFTTDVTVGVTFMPDKGNALYYVVNGGMHDDLTSAINQAKSISPKTVVVAQNGIVSAGNYTIPSGVTLFVPYDKSNSYQTTPTVVTAASALSPYRVLTLQDGVNITCNGNICVGGQIMSAGGGKASAYPTGACGVLDMSRGGHIQLNSGAKLYCWGFIKGQDMEQGNNTAGAGTITAKSGAVVWEMFAVGDWRGGTACSELYSNRSSWKFFPFQSYTIQNIEVQTTYEYGSTLSNYTNVYGDGSKNAGTFSLIGKSNTLFLMQSGSTVKKWYDPTTDLVCYEMTGDAQLNELNVDVDITTVSSGDYNLPISSSMHIIMNSDATISKPMLVQAGAVIEVKSGYTLTCSSNVYIFDKDNWGEYCNKKYYYTMTNLTNHKNRGNGTSNELIDDAKLIIDGTLNVTGKMYTTAGGADIMSNGGGIVTFSTLPSATSIVMCTGVSTNEDVAVASANLHNEDESYTQVKNNNSTFYNVNGRWFVSGKQNEKSDHTYDFTYISSGAVSGSGGTTTTTDAVYTWDKKAALDLTQKWHNVSADACANWWVGTDTYLYNWTENSAWHQFIPTATAGMYSGSNNKIYTKTDCTWEELGETDVNCLYTIGGVKKALVDGEFIALKPNNNDPAYHAADDDTKYYICFEGCNWHAADKYTEAEKAYVVGEDIFIWYNGVWMKAEWKDPFFYTLSETDVPIYYEYLNGEWVLAEPYVSVVDGIESRTYWFIQDAFTFASGALRKNPTIKILRDISGITTAVTYTGTNKICTLDLNGHTITGNVSGLITVNLAGCTFTIVDNTEEKEGKISLVFSANNSRRYALNVKNGHVILKSGTISGTCTLAYNKSSAPKPLTGCVAVASGKQFTMDGGKVEAVAPYNPIAIVGSEGTPTITINAGTVEAVAQTIDSPYGIYAYGTINFNGGTVNSTAEKSSTAIGIYVLASTKAQGTLNMTGGTVNATSYTKNTRGVYVNKAFAYDTNEPRSITAVYPASANISGGEINATNKTSTDAEGIYSLGNTTVTSGEINARCSANTTAFGIRVLSGETRISGSPVINATATGTVYGIRVSKETPAIAGTVYNSTLQMDGGTINAQATTGGTVYGIYVGAATLANTATHASNSKSYAGNYANAGTATITGGTVHATAHTNTAYGVFVDAKVTESDASGYATATATPKCTINGGYFTAQAAAPAAAVQPVNATVLAENLKISGGYYSHDDNLNTYAVSPKHSVALPETDANYDPYFYKVAESYSVTFKNGSEVLQSGYQEKGKTPVYNGDAPTKASTSTTSYIFDGWSTSNGGAKVSPLPAVTSAGATYYAHFAETTLKYTVSFDAKTNGGEEETTVIYVEPNTGVGTLPTATKEGYTFNGWFTAASDGTKITTATVPTGDVTYYAQFTVKKYNLSWNMNGGKVKTAGKYGSTSWPAAKATGTQSKDINYGITITAPVVTRTGYTFHSWSPLVAATMPAEAVTYTAQWTPNANTAYTVKHYQQNVDGTYPTDPTETQALTGTTGESVTPAVKNYEGFTAPATQTKAIAADGKMVIEYKYQRMHYTITLDAATNGGTSEQPSIEVIHGATIGTVPPDAQKGCNDFTGWFTKPVGGNKITSDFTIEYNLKTLYAQFSSEVRKYTITYAAGANGTGSVAPTTKTCDVSTTLSSSKFTRTGYTQTGWSLTDGGTKAYELGAAYTDNDALTLYPFWKINTYTILWKSEDGSSTLETDANQEYGTATVFNGTTPTKDATAQYIYTFDGWATVANGDKVYEIGATPTVIAAATYYAHFAATLQKYTVSVAATPAGYGTVSAATVAEVPYGTAVTTKTNKITVNGKTITATPTTATAQYTYAFSKWNNVPATVTGNVSIEAVFTRTVNNYTVTWKNEDGTVLETDASVAYGNTPSFDGATPTKKTTEEYTYTFKEWTPAISNVTGDVTYTATYTATQNVASVTVGSTTTYYTTITDAWDFVNDQTANTTIKLLQDATTTESLVFTPKAAMTCTLDLNNHTLSGAVNKLIDIDLAKSTFVIDDSSEDKNGKIIAEYSVNARLYAVFLTAGTLNLKAGHIHSKNPHKYSSAAGNKNSAATGLYVTTGQTFTMDGGTVESESQYNSIAIFASESGTTPITINGGRVYGHTTASTSGIGIYTYAKDLEVNGGTIIGHAYTTTAYGIYVRGGSATLNGGRIEATNDDTHGTTTCYGIYARGPITIPATSTVDVFAQARTNTAYAVAVYAGITGNTIAGGTFTAKAKTGKTAGGIYSAGNITVSGGTFTTTTKTTNAYGIYSVRGTATVNGDPTFDVTAGSTTAYGAYAYGTIGANGKSKYSGTINIKGGTFIVTSTKENAWGAYAALVSKTVNEVSDDTDTIAGTHHMPGIISITDGTFNVKAKTTAAYGIVVAGSKKESGQVGTTTRRPTATITGGNFKVESAGDANATAYATNTSASATYLKVEGGKYSTKKISATANIEDKYTAPTKSCDYWVFNLEGEDPYRYEVAVGYKVTWNAEANGGSCATEFTPVRKGAAIGTLPEATKADNDFLGWYTAATDGTKITEETTVSKAVTYYAQFKPRGVKITWMSEDGNTILETDPLALIGSTPSFDSETPTKASTEDTEYTFDGWTTEANGGGTSYQIDKLPEVTVATTYYAHFSEAERFYGEKYRLDIADWSGNTASGTVTLNMNGYSLPQAKTNWKVKVGAQEYTKADWETSTRLLNLTNIDLSTAGSNVLIKVYDYKEGSKTEYECVSRLRYQVPIVVNSSDALSTLSPAATSDVRVRNNATLTVSSNATLRTVLVDAGSALKIESGATLTVTDRLVLRTRTTKDIDFRAPELINNGTLKLSDGAKMYYSRVVSDNSELYPIGFPFEVTLSQVILSNSNMVTATRGTHFALQSYDAEHRAESGMGGNWMLYEGDKMEASKGYLLLSTSKYYREFLFPVSYSKPSDGATVPVEAHESNNPSDEGWNMIVTPFTANASTTPTGNPSQTIKIAKLYEDNVNYYQAVATNLEPATPFYYQHAGANNGFLSFQEMPNKILRRSPLLNYSDRSVEEEWVRLSYGKTSQDGRRDETNIFAHPDRFTEEYESGADVVKMSTTGERALLYSSLACGELAFAAVPDSLLEQGLPLTVNSPSEGEYRFELEPTDNLNRLESLYLYDDTYGSMIDLLESDYTTDVAAGVSRGRFRLFGVYRAPQIATDIDVVNGGNGDADANGGNGENGEKPRKIMRDGYIYILMPNGDVYSVIGRKME